MFTPSEDYICTNKACERGSDCQWHVCTRSHTLTHVERARIPAPCTITPPGRKRPASPPELARGAKLLLPATEADSPEGRGQRAADVGVVRWRRPCSLAQRIPIAAPWKVDIGESVSVTMPPSGPSAPHRLVGILLKQKYSEGRMKNDWFREIAHQIVEEVGLSNQRMCNQDIRLAEPTSFTI